VNVSSGLPKLDVSVECTVTDPEAPVETYLSDCGESDTDQAVGPDINMRAHIEKISKCLPGSTPAPLLSKLSFFPITLASPRSQSPVVPSRELKRALVPLASTESELRPSGCAGSRCLQFPVGASLGKCKCCDGPNGVYGTHHKAMVPSADIETTSSEGVHLTPQTASV
jgi:hypothetical protein